MFSLQYFMELGLEIYFNRQIIFFLLTASYKISCILHIIRFSFIKCYSDSNKDLVCKIFRALKVLLRTGLRVKGRAIDTAPGQVS